MSTQMNKRQKTLKQLPTLTVVLLWTVFLALAACSNQTANESPAGKIFADSSSTASRQTHAVLADSSTVQKDEQTKLYSQAIAEYIKAVYKRDKSSFDTLFFGKHVDFPDIELPATIQNTKIILLTSEEADKKREYRKSLVFINMFGWITKDKSEFILVTFYPGYLHQFDCMINFKYNSAKKEFELEKLQFKNYAYK